MSEWNEAIEAAGKEIHGWLDAQKLLLACGELSANGKLAARSVIALLEVKVRSLKRPSSPVGEWKPIETAPRDGGYIVTNRKRQVAFCDSRDSRRTIHNMPGFVEWTYGESETHWQPLPPAPSIDRGGEK